MRKRPIKYNPAFLTEEELIESYVVRHTDLDMIVRVVRENLSPSANQHVLVIGPRGIGKTMCVLRVASEVRRTEDLAQKWYPLVFAEESYQVSTPGEFWLEAIFHLGLQTKDQRWKRVHAELNAEVSEERLRERALAQLMDFADSEGKRLLLIVENLNMLLGEQLSDDDAWTLRHTLLNEPRIMLLATATSRFEEMESIGKAMFELFRPHELGPLDEEECGELWTSVAGEEIHGRRIRPIQILTGGNPRLITIIASFAARLSLKELLDDLVQLVDDHTEYFKSHLDNLAPTERKVYLSLAELWDESAARDVAAAARMDVSKTSALLNRLVRRGTVAVSAERPRRKRYRVAERMYNIYHLMRRRGEPSTRIKALIAFMIPFYEPTKLIRLAQRIAREACQLDGREREDHYLAYKAIWESPFAEQFRQDILHETPPEFFRDPCFPRSILSQLQEAPCDKAGIDPAIEHAIGLTEEGWRVWTKEDNLQEAERLFRESIDVAPGNAGAWFSLGCLLHLGLERYAEAEEAYRRATELDSDDWFAWLQLGRLLHTHPERHVDAEAAYRRAIQLKPDEPDAWLCLAGVLGTHLQRPKEAEEILRRVLDMAPEHVLAWGLYGWLLQKQLGQPEAAESAYRKVIELDPEEPLGWESLGTLLHEDLRRLGEAEEAYKRAVDLEPTVRRWCCLGRFLHIELKRYDEAEEAYRKATELEPNDSLGWALLGVLLAYDSTRLAQAEQALRKAIELRPEVCPVWEELILLQLRKPDGWEAIRRLLPQYLGLETVGDGSFGGRIDLFVRLAAAGYAAGALGAIEASDQAVSLQPIVVGLKLYLGQDVTAPVEVLEVGRDVAERIKTAQREMEGKGRGEGSETRDSG